MTSSPRPIRAFKSAPRAKLAIAGDPRYLVHFSPSASWDGAPYVAFLAEAPAKVLAGAKAIDGDGALIVRRSLVEKALAPWIEQRFVRLLPVAVASIKEPNQPKFDKPAADVDFVIIDPLIEAAADRRALAGYSFTWGKNVPQSSRERALLTSWDQSPFIGDRAPPEPIFRANELPIDVWVGADVDAALQEALGGYIVEGRSRPSPPFVPATDFTPLPGTDADAEAAAASWFAGVASGDIASPRGPSQLSKTERARILASPRYAYLLGRREGPADDTRTAAIRHPYYALAYGREVDGAPRDDTRKAAATTVETAILYATDVDREAHPTTRNALKNSYRLGDYDERLARLAAIREGQAGVLERMKLTSAVSSPRASSLGAAPPASSPQPRTKTVAFEVVMAKGFAEASIRRATGEEPSWGDDIHDGDVSAIIGNTKAGATTAKSIGKIGVLAERNTGPWLIREKTAEELFTGVSGVALRKASVTHKGKKLAGDFVYVDVVEERPLDRDVAKATYADPKRHWSSVVRAFTEVAVVGAPADALVLARVSEFPSVLVATEALVGRWKKAKAPIVAVKPPHAHLRPLPLFPPWDEGPLFPKIEVPSTTFHAALAGDAAARAKAVRHPLFAYLLARLVDREASDATREGALGHPHTAALYARFVDQEPRPDTRAAVASCGPTALFYARFVDQKLTKDIRAALLARGFGKEDLKELEEQLRT